MDRGQREKINIIIGGAAKETMDFLKEFLEEQGKKVEVCSRAEQLEPRLGQLEPCILLMLWREEKPEWEQVLRSLHQKKEKNHLLLMVVTPSRDSLKAAQELGAHELILYPFQREELLCRLRAVQGQIYCQQRLKAAEKQTVQPVAELEVKFYSVVGRLAHDLNTPLAAAYMSCDLLATQGGKDLTLAHRQTLEQVNFSLGELKRTIAAMGDWVGLMQGQLKPSLKPMDWREPLEVKKEDWAELEAIARRDQKKILIEASPQLPAALADKELIGKTLIHLLQNSLHYTGRGDQIRLKVNADDKEKQLLFCVEDSGKNMPTTLTEMVFEWGISREEHLKGLRWGRGVGLNFCKEAVEVCGGKIWVERSEGEGCRFCLSLPLWQNPKENYIKERPPSPGD